MEGSKVQIGVWLGLLASVLLIASTGAQERLKEDGAGGERPAAKADPAVIARLIAQLGNNDFKKREEASRRLAELDEVPSALRRAAEGSDPEVARRARAVITAITDRAEERAFRALLRDPHQVELDRFVRRMVTDKKSAGEKEWKVLQAVAKAVTAAANKSAGRRLPVPDFDVKAMPRLLLNAGPKNPVSIQRSTVLSAGTTPYITAVSNSLVIVDGDFTGATGIDNSLLIVRGNVGRVTSVRNSIILATGNWEGATAIDGSLVQVSSYLIQFTTARDSVLINSILRTNPRTTSRTVTTDKGPLRLVKFSPRPSDARLAWGPEVNNLAVAVTALGADGHVLIRWKNVGRDAFQLPWVRLNSRPTDGGHDDLMGHVLLKGPDGKLAPARQPPAPGRIPGRLDRYVILGPGRTHEEVINLGSYVAKPAAGGTCQLSIELDIPAGRRGRVPGMKTWSGKIRSKAIDLPLGK